MIGDGPVARLPKEFRLPGTEVRVRRGGVQATSISGAGQ